MAERIRGTRSGRVVTSREDHRRLLIDEGSGCGPRVPSEVIADDVVADLKPGQVRDASAAKEPLS